MIVLKLGGTSLQDASHLLRRVPLVRERLEDGCLVVASAMAGVSRALLEVVWAAEAGNGDGAAEGREALTARHRAVVEEAGIQGPARRACLTLMESESARLGELLRPGPEGRVPPRARDRILAVGELLSSRLLAAVLESRGLDATWVDPRELIVSDDTFGRARYDAGRTRVAARRCLEPLLGPGRAVVTAGFIARSRQGDTTTLGWGASDTSATLLAASLGASSVEIWTDVDGIATADPRLVEGARPIRRLSFQEASDLAFFGAQVLHYSSIAPVRAAGIPLRVRSSFQPEAPGTLIELATVGSGPPVLRGITVAGPMTPSELSGLSGCGVDGTGADPPWALVKGRTFPHDSPDGAAEALSILTLVGHDVDDAPARGRIETLLSEGEPLVSSCHVHRAFRIPAADATELLRSAHALAFPDEEDLRKRLKR